MGFRTNEKKSKVLRFRSPSNACPHPEKSKERILLLQGPVGPFFKYLRTYLESQDYEVWHICFHAGDSFYSHRRHRINFDGNLSEWKDWCTDFIRAAKIDKIVLFGSERPVHQVAREVAQKAFIPVVALEEGYIRPGLVTVESGGNNASSPLAGRLPPSDVDPNLAEKREAGYHSGYANTFQNIIYYMIRNVFTFGKQTELYHKRFTLFSEMCLRTRWIYRTISGHARNFSIIQNLLEHRDGQYFIVPLQVESDCQLKEFALGWTQKRMISAILKSFAKHAPKEMQLVFKVHPVFRGHSNDRSIIMAMAEVFGAAERVHVVDAGSLGLLTRHSAGMITLNSTSGLSAIHHGVPLKVIGKAFYALPELAVCSNGNPDFDSFWSNQHVASKEVRHGYLSWIRQHALVPGDFYATHGMESACKGILKKLQQPHSNIIKFEAVKVG